MLSNVLDMWDNSKDRFMQKEMAHYLGTDFLFGNSVFCFRLETTPNDIKELQDKLKRGEIDIKEFMVTAGKMSMYMPCTCMHCWGSRMNICQENGEDPMVVLPLDKYGFLPCICTRFAIANNTFYVVNYFFNLNNEN